MPDFTPLLAVLALAVSGLALLALHRAVQARHLAEQAELRARLQLAAVARRAGLPARHTPEPLRAVLAALAAEHGAELVAAAAVAQLPREAPSAD